FNAHLRDTCLLLADEAFFSGDRASIPTLKRLATDATITIERKGFDAFESRNTLSIFMCSNDKHVVPVGEHERRFFVLNVSPEHRLDLPYFDALEAELKSGGYERLMWELLAEDLDKFNVRRVPHTEALAEQRLESLTPEEAW